MKIGTIIQARSSSTRLPQKIFMELPCGSKISVLEQVIRRVKKSLLSNETIVATTGNTRDDRVVKTAVNENVKSFRGSENNVLDRYYQAAKKYNLDHIVRITCDCPCIDPNVIDEAIKIHINKKNDLTTTILGKRTYPHGIEVEVFSFQALEKSQKKADNLDEKEHINLYIENHKQDFRIGVLKAKSSQIDPKIRITLDMPEDYTLLCAVFDFLYHDNHFFRTEKIVSLFKEKPWLYDINKNVIQKNDIP